ncbi:MAG TPA: CU044_5270 family protein, partial [Solirubrobacterales bacterium]|nr:CU044_5270 family protein [Solirubrobacterales bacterium]
MNEIELLRELRAGLPPARPEARAAARGRLLAAAEHAGPAGATQLWRAPRLRLALAGLALAAIVLVVPIGILGGGGGAQSALGNALDRAARVAAAREPLAPGPGEFLFTRSEDAYLRSTAYSPHCSGPPCEATEEWSVLVPSTREVWASFDGSRLGRVRQVTGRPRFLSKAQREGWVAAGSPALPRAGQVEDSPLASGGFIDASGLPVDPASLRGMIEAREIPGVEGPPGEAETFELIGEMLRESYLPSEIRAAIYRLTAELPGARLLGRVRDPAGRWGTGISYPDRRRGVRHVLIFDPRTSALLGERDTL